MLRLPEMPAVQYDTVALDGGFDQTTSAYKLPPGALRDCINFACRTNGGYYRIPGYERLDGRPAPSEAVFLPIDITLLPGKSIAVGNSGTFGNVTGVVSYVDPFGRYVSVTKTTSMLADPFVPGNIVIGGDIKGTTNSYYAGLTIKDLAINKAAAANIYRADIQPVPGSGPIRGVVFYKDDAYAFRNNVAGTACEIYKSTVSGWSKVTLGKTLKFSAMSVAPSAEGVTLTKGTTTAKIDRWVITSGDLTDGTAAGYFVISNVVNGPFTDGAATYPSGTVTVDGPEVQIVIQPGGTYSFSLGNFTAYFDTERIYGADGVNDAFEFDGAVYVPLPVATPYKPKYAQVHANHLFLAVGSSVIHSGLGNPYNFEVIQGAGEIGTGGLITGLLVLPGNQGTSALGVFSRTSTWILYGTSSADWNFVNFNLGIGAWDRTTQNLFDAFGMDDRGVTMMSQSLKYGNFEVGTLTYNIRPFIHAQQGKVVCSGLNRENGQYRAYFNNGYALYITTLPEGLVGHGIALYPHPVTCNFDGDKSSGENISIFGTESGYVMQNDLGTSFDGQQISSYLNTNVNCVKTPRLRKRFRKCVLEIQASAYVEMQVGYAFEWASSRMLPHNFEDAEGFFSGLSFWDDMIWDAFFWDGKSDDAISVNLDGTGENLQLQVLTRSDYIAEFTLPSVIFHYTPRRGNR